MRDSSSVVKVGVVPEVLITRCAWCARYDVDGGWLAPKEVSVFARDDGSDTSHGICPDCIADLRVRGLSV